MLEPLRVGVAGLGTVGAAVVRILARQDNALAERCGRPDPGHGGLGARPGQGARHRHLGPCLVRRSGRPRALAGGRLRRRADRRRRRRGEGHGRDRARLRPARRHGEQGAPRQARAGAGARSPRRRGVALRLRGRGGRRHPGHQDPARGPARQRGLARLRHPQRHLQLHPVAHGDRRASPSRPASRTRSGSATPRPTRPSTSRASTPPTSSRS